MQWTIDQVKALAPDTSSLKAAQSTADAHHWSGLGRTEQALWGDCKGSSSTPYGVQIDLSEPAFKCTCPSRKFPCKHALALMLLAVDHPALLPQSDPPSRVKEWLESRAQKAQRVTKKAEGVVDPAAQAKRAEKRDGKILDGVQQAELWISDLVRQGLASVQSRYYDYWDSMAARMVDAQAPGLARQFRMMAGIPASGEGWPARLLERLSLTYLLTQGYQRIDALPEPMQAEVRTAIGLQVKQEDVLADHGVRDHWLVMGRRVDEQENLKTQRTWLWGHTSERPALILDFAFKGATLDATLLPGIALDAEIAFYPGTNPLRAALKRAYRVDPHPQPAGYTTIQQGLSAYAEAAALNPWLDTYPFSLMDVIPSAASGEWIIVDSEQSMLRLAPAFTGGWNLLSVSGGHPVTVTGEWTGQHFLPLGVWAEGRYLNL